MVPRSHSFIEAISQMVCFFTTQNLPAKPHILPKPKLLGGWCTSVGMCGAPFTTKILPTNPPNFAQTYLGGGVLMGPSSPPKSLSGKHDSWWQRGWQTCSYYFPNKVVLRMFCSHLKLWGWCTREDQRSDGRKVCWCVWSLCRMVLRPGFSVFFVAWDVDGFSLVTTTSK